MNSFDHMIPTLLRSDAFRDSEFVPIGEKEYDIFCKEYVFDKLRGDSFGMAFRKRFSCQDRVLSMFSHQEDVMAHIAYCGYVK